MAEPSAAGLDRIVDGATPDLMLEIERDGAVRGILEAYRAEDGHAEIALSVEDAYQGIGLGRTLFEEGLRHFAQRGYQAADLFCLRENIPVLHLAQDVGGRIEDQGSEARIEIELSPALDQAQLPLGRPRLPDRGKVLVGNADVATGSDLESVPSTL